MALTVTENENGSLTIDWDEEDNEVFANFKAEDFINLISQYTEKSRDFSQNPNVIIQEEVNHYLNSESEGKDFDTYYDDETTVEETTSIEGYELP